MVELTEAREVTLKKINPLAPPFHRHIARSRLMGKPCKVGDRVVVYEIADTVPKGSVLVTQKSVIRFE